MKNTSPPPQKLVGIRQALYILERLTDSHTEQMVITEFEDDEQLVLIWISFLLHNGWMEKPDGKWLVTDKGKMWAEKYRNT